jgi:Tfp pilus assembly protein PilV
MIVFHKTKLRQAGTTLVEVLVAIGLSGIMLPALAAAIITSNDARPTATQQLLANGILQEMTTATRSVREKGWSNIATNGTYYPTTSGNAWALTSGTTTTAAGFTESIVISSVQRNTSTLAIVASGGTVDPSTKLVTETVSWTKPTSSSVSQNMYLTRWPKEAGWTQTTVADFDGDTLTNTQVTNTAGGEVKLKATSLTGTLTSSGFNAATSSALNYISFDASQPNGTSVKFQIATSPTNGSFTYLGPDGTASTYYTANSAIAISMTPNQYFSYKATFTATTLGTSAILDDITLSYSP